MTKGCGRAVGSPPRCRGVAGSGFAVVVGQIPFVHENLEAMIRRLRIDRVSRNGVSADVFALGSPALNELTTQNTRS